MSLTATTLNGAIDSTQNLIRLTSGTGAAVGSLIRIEDETVSIQSIADTPTLRVARGVAGTAALAHATGARAVIGLPEDFPVRPAPRTTNYTAAGAITIQPGTHVLKGGAAIAMTLASPAANDDGIVMEIVNGDASANTVTYTAGFSGDTTSSDVATYAAKVGNSLLIKAVNGVWMVLGNEGVTIA